MIPGYANRWAMTFLRTTPTWMNATTRDGAHIRKQEIADVRRFLHAAS